MNMRYISNYMYGNNLCNRVILFYYYLYAQIDYHFLKHSTSLVYFNLILKPFEWIGKNLVKFTQPKILKYNIILESTNECYRKCGIDPKKIPAIYNEIKDSDIRTNINLKFSKSSILSADFG